MSRRLMALIPILATLFASCGAKPPQGIEVTIVPQARNVYPFYTIQFYAYVKNATESDVRWTLAGAGCAGTACGTLSDTGLYTAPPRVPTPATVTVTATSVADPSKSASASVTVVDGPAASNQWTWVSGSYLVDRGVFYGVKGVADPSNDPGSRCGALAWRGGDGSLWLYSGAQRGKDLWAYDPLTDMWTWVWGSSLAYETRGHYGIKGVPDPSNDPGARTSSSGWTDGSGDFWLFGGYGVDTDGIFDRLCDLWKYDPLSGLWTWVSGSDRAWQSGIYGSKGVPDASNRPGGRIGHVSWADPAGRFWIFGGEGFDATPEQFNGMFNDLWMYDPAEDLWTWVSGSLLINQAGIYGVRGTADPANSPGSRRYATAWSDAQGRLWLFGGGGYDAAGREGTLNDLWMFDPSSGQWTWVSGSDLQGQPGNYGTRGTPSPANMPGGRSYAVSWVDPSGLFWIFGGSGIASAGTGGRMNDLWRFDPATLEWTWMAGASVSADPGHYGAPHIVDPLDGPASRHDAMGWLGTDGDLWIFGGEGVTVIDNTTFGGRFNDLWRYRR